MTLMRSQKYIYIHIHTNMYMDAGALDFCLIPSSVKHDEAGRGFFSEKEINKDLIIGNNILTMKH